MRKLYAAGLLLCFVLSLNGFSQSTNATLGGTVQDPTGAFFPGVTITATNTGTGIVTTVLTNEPGAYQFASLQPGTYDISELARFQTAVAQGFQLGGAQQARFNFTLQVGTTATTVDVTATADARATSSNSVGTVFPNTRFAICRWRSATCSAWWRHGRRSVRRLCREVIMPAGGRAR